MNAFTPRAAQVLALSRREAEYLHHDYVGTEHLLLGLVRLGQGVAVNILKAIGLDLAEARGQVEKLVGKGHGTTPAIKIPFTVSVKKAIALAGKEAKALGHSVVGTEHILLGLLRENGAATRLIRARGAEIDHVRARTLERLGASQKTADLGPRYVSMRVAKAHRVRIVMMSGFVCILLILVAWFELFEPHIGH
jgi:ATP-dependent Clp protease ATP-binding subunit ClpC